MTDKMFGMENEGMFKELVENPDDIRIVVEQELIRSNKQLDQVIYKTTHDLKAPIRSAMGLVNLAEKAPVAKKAQYFELIKKSLLKLDSFIEEMNNFFRIEKLALQRDKLNIVELLREELDILRSLHEENKIDIRLRFVKILRFILTV